MKVNTSTLVKVIKALTSLLKKDDFIYLYFLENELQIRTEVNSFFASIGADYQGQRLIGRTKVSEFATVSKLTKKDQVGVVELDVTNNALAQKLPNGLSLHSSFESFDLAQYTEHNIADDLVYLESTQVSLLSKVLQKQKDLTYLTILDFGFLAVGDRQVSYINVAPEKEEFVSHSTLFTNTQLNNLNAVTQEIGFSQSNYLVWGCKYASQLDLLNQGSEVEFQVEFSKKEATLTQFDFDKWKQLKQRFERELTPVTLTIQNTKQLEKLITSSKSGIPANDPYDLVIVDASAETQELSFYFYQDRQLKNSFTIASEVEIESDTQLNLQTKHLLSMLNLANNELTIQYLSESEPIWSKTDLGVQTITTMSMVI